jgi:hypothetical protein
MVRLYESGLSLAAVGKRVGKSVGTVKGYVIERGVQTRDRHGRVRSAGVKKPFRIRDQNQIDEVVDLYGQGKSAATVRKELGINPATVRFAL